MEILEKRFEWLQNGPYGECPASQGGAAEAMLRKPGGASCISALAYNPARSMTLLAKSTIRPEDAQNPIRHLGLERGFAPSIAAQTAASEFANSVVPWRLPEQTLSAAR